MRRQFAPDRGANYPSPGPSPKRGGEKDDSSPLPASGRGRGRGSSLSRREALSQIALGFGGVALTALLAEEAQSQPSLGRRANSGPLAPKPPHFPAKAKRVIFLFMHGGGPHDDPLHPNAKLTAINGKPPPV